MDNEQYVVVARRYRPQRFEELIGQEHVSRALSGAINTQRVGHAYLFTGARGVGKTSAARILAKALNCEKGPAPEPCNECDICSAVSGGDDVDVLEIDGASNRGIDEIRQLRQNVNVRPSRARYKIYIIDEVHMLTREAFNALLKTLEEPPEHVKFIFCTTEPEKVPITVISRCQRFDFAGIQPGSIVERLRQIVEAEGLEAEPEALEFLARRAAGSMRDSQSLLEQLMAFGGEKITVGDVHRMLGTAATGRIASLLKHIVSRDAGGAISELDAALAEGVDVGQLLDQLLGYYRDLMVAAVGSPAELLLHASPGESDTIAEVGGQFGVETILSMMQIVDQTLARMRVSTHRRTLAELALVRICKLENLEAIAGVVQQLASGTAPTPAIPAMAPPSSTPAPTPAPPAAKKKPPVVENGPAVAVEPPAAESPPPPASTTALTADSVEQVWKQAISELGDMASAAAAQCEEVAILAPNRLVVRFPAKYSMGKSVCEQPEQTLRIEQALAKVTGNAVRVEFALSEESASRGETPSPKRPTSPREQLKQAMASPFVQRASELFGATPQRVEEAKEES